MILAVTIESIIVKELIVMAFIESADRNQINLFPNTLDDYVSEDNPVRVIDAYVESLKLEEIGFKTYSGNNAGQKPYKRKYLLKLYIYCYMNRIRSSRRIEIEATRNMEVMWLIGKVTPDHGTISEFMKANRKAIKQLFKEFTLMLKGFGLVNGKVVGIDGTKIKASNSKSKHFNENIIKKKIEYYEAKIDEYINGFLETSENQEMKQVMDEKVESYKSRIDQLNSLKKELKDEGKKQVCITDPEAKSMKNNGKFEVCYNMQAVVDSKYKFLVDFEVVNDINDQSQLSNMVTKTKSIFSDQKITVLADTGYFNMSEILAAVDESTEILIKKQKDKEEKIKSGFEKANFQYDKTKDIYRCPLGYPLEFKWNGKNRGKNYRRYVCKGYMDCGNKADCTSAKAGRAITRFEDEEIIDKVHENTIRKKDLYKLRGSIVEHPFGNIKRFFGYTHFLTRGLDSVNAEAGFISLAYNLKRLINIMGVKDLVRFFKRIFSYYKLHFYSVRVILS